MIQRCTNPRNKAWKNYGGRGIKIGDQQWLIFDNFLADMGELLPGMCSTALTTMGITSRDIAAGLQIYAKCEFSLAEDS
jgi:hypothetical protein